MTDQNKNSGHHITLRQVLAIAGIVILVLLYAALLFSAIFDRSETFDLFFICLFATMAVPLLLWIYIRLFDNVRRRREEAQAANGQLQTPHDSGLLQAPDDSSQLQMPDNSSPLQASDDNDSTKQ